MPGLRLIRNVILMQETFRDVEYTQKEFILFL